MLDILESADPKLKIQIKFWKENFFFFLQWKDILDFVFTGNDKGQSTDRDNISVDWAWINASKLSSNSHIHMASLS